jgi:hypothetical protein
MTLIYIDLALLLYQNFISQVDKPQNVVGYDNESGSLVVQPNKQSNKIQVRNEVFKLKNGVRTDYIVEETVLPGENH